MVGDSIGIIEKVYSERGETISPELKMIFEESNRQYLGHMTTNGMGMDIADINDDGFSDVLVLDMLPNKYKKLKRVMIPMNYSGFMNVENNLYASQYMRNTLQLGNGQLKG